MRIFAIFAFLLVSTGCRRTTSSPNPANTDSFPDRPPVVVAEPVDTASYEAGYRAGYSVGTTAATPRATVPSDNDAAQLADEMAGNDPAHNPKWRRGWASGYLEGFRARALNAK